MDEPGPSASGTGSSAAGGSTPSPPTALVLVVAYDALVFAVALVAAGFLARETLRDARGPEDALPAALYLALALAALLAGVLHGFASWGVARVRPWGRPFQLAAAALGLFGCWTSLSSAAILLYVGGLGARGFFARGDDATVGPLLAEARRRFRARRLDALPMALALLSGPLAALALPGWFAAEKDRANEARAIGDVRVFVSAEAAYAAVNDGFADTPACLAAPWDCLPGHPSGQAPFLDRGLAESRQAAGYTRTFHPGPPARPAPEQIGRVSPSSLAAFAYVAVPDKGPGRGLRAICGDATGLVCATGDGSPPRVADGACDRTSCRALP